MVKLTLDIDPSHQIARSIAELREPSNLQQSGARKGQRAQPFWRRRYLGVAHDIGGATRTQSVRNRDPSNRNMAANRPLQFVRYRIKIEASPRPRMSAEGAGHRLHSPVRSEDMDSCRHKHENESAST
jgi:hypothetical protein